MTDRRGPRRKRPSAVPVAGGSLAAFFALFGFLTYQLGTGHDPALSRKPVAVTAPAPKRVLVKRIEHRIVVTTVLPPKDDEGEQRVVAAPAPARPVVTQAPVQSAPAPPPGPAPAPRPAPVVTRSS